MDAFEAKKILEEDHKEIYGMHGNRQRTAREVIHRLLLVDSQKRLHQLCPKMP